MLIFIILARLKPLPVLITFANSLDNSVNSRFETLYTVFVKDFFLKQVRKIHTNLPSMPRVILNYLNNIDLCLLYSF